MNFLSRIYFFITVTRSKARILYDNGIGGGAIVKIMRRVNYDKALLNRPSANITRRRTIQAVQTPKIMKPSLKRKSMAARVTFSNPSVQPSTATTVSVPTTTIALSTPRLATIMVRRAYTPPTSSPLAQAATPTTPPFQTKTMIQPKSA